MRNQRTFLICCTVLFLFTPGSGLKAQDEVQFNRDVRPILAENCFECHGFDAKTRKADMRLDTADGAYADQDGSIAVKPGKRSCTDFPASSSIGMRVMPIA